MSIVVEIAKKLQERGYKVAVAGFECFGNMPIENNLTFLNKRIF